MSTSNIADNNSDDRSITKLLVESPELMKLGSWLAIGIVAVCLWLLYLAENLSVRATITLEQNAAKVVEITPDEVRAENDGKLVHITGEVSADQPAVDLITGISAPALKLDRKVEMFQWIEKKNEKKKGDKTVVSYTYSKEWSSNKPEENFEDPEGHVNPKFPYSSDEFTAINARLGPFFLTSDQLEKLQGEVAFPITQEILDARTEDQKKSGVIDQDGKVFVSKTEGSAPQNPAVGDVRLAYTIVRPQTVSIVAQQTGNTFAPFVVDAGVKFDMIKTGVHSAKEMFETERGQHHTLFWAFRVLILIPAALAAYLMLRRMAGESGYSVGTLNYNIGLAIFGGFIALSAILVLVALRWVLLDPMFTGKALACGGGGLAISYLILRRYDKSGTFTPIPKFTAKQREMFKRIALDPKNKALRLELADSLMRSKNPIGEFIKVSHELDGMALDDARRTKLDDRWEKLHSEHSRLWFLPLSKLGLAPYFGNTFAPWMWMEDGIIQRCTIDLPGLLPQKAAKIFAAAPGLNELELHSCRSTYDGKKWKEFPTNFDIPAVFAVPQLEQIVTLNLTRLKLKPSDLEVVVRSPHLKNLKQISFGDYELGPAGAEVIAKSSRLPSLEYLDVSSCNFGDAGATALANSLELTHLKKLNLGSNDLSVEGVRAVITSIFFVELTELNLEANYTEGVAAVLASSMKLPKLDTLKLGNMLIDSEGFKALYQSELLSGLKSLNLDSNGIAADGLSGLATSSKFGGLEELSLTYNCIGDEGLSALAAWPGLVHIKKLNLRSNGISAVGIAALGASPYLQSLEELDLSDSEAGIGGARTLSQQEALLKLKSLTIERAYLTTEGENLLKARFGARVTLS